MPCVPASPSGGGLAGRQTSWTKSPLRSFGSNHVDFGGMISPASHAAHERDARVRARVADAEDRREQAVLKVRDVQGLHRACPLRDAPGEVDPAFVEVHPAVARASAADLERFREAGHELVGGESVQVAHEAVVGQDLQLARGEGDGEEPAAFALEAVRLRVAGGCRAAVVTVGDVGDRDPREELLELVGDARRMGGDLPDRVADAVGGNEVVERRGAAGVRDDQVDRLVVAVGQERRARVRLQRLDVPRPVVLLVRARLLVLLEDAGEVVLGVEGRDDAGLAVCAHRLAVGVELRLRVAHERAAREKPVEGLLRLRVGLGRGRRRAVGEVDLRTRDVEEALRVSGGEGLRLHRVDHVIRNGRDRGRVRHVRPHGRERADFHEPVRSRC